MALKSPHFSGNTNPPCLSLIKKDPLAVPERSLRHDLTQLIEPAARASLSTPIEKAFEGLPSHYFVPWVR